jgi:nitroreductase
VSINELVRARFGQASTVGKSVTANETLSNILSRRSHRAFKPEPVPRDLLDTLLATAFSAPSKSDLQQASVILVQDRAKQRRIAQLSAYTDWLADAPVFMVWCGDSRRIRKLAEWRGNAFANDHLDAFMNAAVDAGICMQTFIVAAESIGLGCCPVSQIRDQIEPLSQELALPEFVFPVAGLCLGWPQDLGSVNLRLPMTVTTHIDAYQDDNLVAEVSAYDRRREAIDKTPPQQQRMVKEFGVAPEYGWSENRTRQYSQPARQDFGAYIRRQGFDLS